MQYKLNNYQIHTLFYNECLNKRHFSFKLIGSILYNLCYTNYWEKNYGNLHFHVYEANRNYLKK